MEKNKARGGVVGVEVLGEFQQPIKCVQPLKICLHNCWDCPGKTVANVIKHLFTEGCLVFCTPGNHLIDLIFFLKVLPSCFLVVWACAVHDS